MVFTQEVEVQPEPELVGWRKVEVKKDNRIVKTLTKYTDPQGKEFSYQEVKKMLGKTPTPKVAKKDVKRKLGPAIPFELEEESPPKKSHASTKPKPAPEILDCSECQVMFRSGKERSEHKKVVHSRHKKEAVTPKAGIPGPPTRLPGPPGPVIRAPGPQIVQDSPIPHNILPTEKLVSETCTLCSFEARSKKKMRNHMKIHQVPEEVHLDEEPVEEDLGAFEIDQMFDSYIDNSKEKVIELEEDDEEIEVLDKTTERAIDLQLNIRSLNISSSIAVTRRPPAARQKEMEVIEYNESEEEEEEDSDDQENEERTREAEEITLDSEPEEITLEEGDEDDSEEECVETKEEAEENELKKLMEVEGLLSDPDFVLRMVEGDDEQILRNFTSNSWYAAPKGWRAGEPGEAWRATVAQVKRYYGLCCVTLEEQHSSQDKFLALLQPLLVEANPGKSRPGLYRLAKALWFQQLEPVIPVLTATLEEEEEYSEEEYEQEGEEYPDEEYGQEGEEYPDEEYGQEGEEDEQEGEEYDLEGEEYKQEVEEYEQEGVEYEQEGVEYEQEGEEYEQGEEYGEFTEDYKEVEQEELLGERVVDFTDQEEEEEEGEEYDEFSDEEQ